MLVHACVHGRHVPDHTKCMAGAHARPTMCWLSASLDQRLSMRKLADLAVFDSFELLGVLMWHVLIGWTRHYADVAASDESGRYSVFVVQQESFKLGPRFTVQEYRKTYNIIWV